jgi:hypothetical protein
MYSLFSDTFIALYLTFTSSILQFNVTLEDVSVYINGSIDAGFAGTGQTAESRYNHFLGGIILSSPVMILLYFICLLEIIQA